LLRCRGPPGPEGPSLSRPAVTSLLALLVAAPTTALAATGGTAAGEDPGSSPSAGPQGTAVVAEVRARRVLLAGPRPQTLTLTLPGTGTADLRVELRTRSEDDPVATWELDDVARGAPVAVTWDGSTADGRGAAAGVYRFAVGVDGAIPEPVASRFQFLRSYFPVRGPHSFGDGLGAGRNHQGVDVLAPCGTPLLAARGGTVKDAGTDGSRGNYVVIDAAGTPSDMAFFHLAAPALVRTGEPVHTGQRIGDVGTTGRSTGCHLHFELWSGPGYLRGRPVDALPQLRRWDAESGAGRAQ
jgi:murein DD-endopeptidase MepM/ murein hydrolase activator NlpD